MPTTTFVGPPTVDPETGATVPGIIVRTVDDKGDGTATETMYVDGNPGTATPIQVPVPVPDEGPLPDPPTDIERLAAAVVKKVDGFTAEDAAQALGVDPERIEAAATV